MVNLMTTYNYPKPGSSSAISEALMALRPLIQEAKQRVNAIPTVEMLNSFSGEKELVRIATAEMLQRIIVDVFKLKLIVDTQLIDAGDSPTVTATVFILTKDGYQVMRTSTASENRGAGNFSPVLSAESRAIRLVLRSIGLRTEGEIFEVENAQQLQDAAQSKTDKIAPNTASAKSIKPAKTANKKNATGKASPEKNEPAIKVNHQKPLEAYGITLDRTEVDYVDKLRQTLRMAKANKPKSISIADFIQTVLGPDSPKRLEGCTTAMLEKLFDHYIINADSTI